MGLGLSWVMLGVVVEWLTGFTLLGLWSLSTGVTGPSLIPDWKFYYGGCGK